MKNNKGFTLIELLVVVAIIGILATVVLASLGSARTSAKDKAVMSELSSMRSEIELTYDGTYTNLCTDVGSVYDKFASGVSLSGGQIEDCDATAGDYRIIASLPRSLVSAPSTAYAAGEDGFCINSLGTAKLVDVTTTMSLTAPACDSSEIEACTGNCFCVNTCTNECNYFVAPNSFGNYGSMPKPECSGAPDCTVGNPPCK